MRHTQGSSRSGGAGHGGKTPSGKTSKARWITLVLLLVVVGAGIAYAVSQQEAPPKPKVAAKQVTSTTEAPKPTTVASPLDGTQVAPAVAARQPIAVVIENHPAARPQSGISNADIVYEVVAEGGITRFLAVYQRGESKTVGPVRSVREYFADLSYSWGAALAHCGGSPSGYNRIQALGVDDLDQFVNGPSYWRVRSRHAPHNLYTSTDKLRALMGKKGYSADGEIPAMDFKDDLEAAGRPSKANITVDFSTKKYKVSWDYAPEQNQYLRTVGGVADKDSNSGAQLSARNIVVIFTDIETVDKKLRVRVTLQGQGRAMFFRDGKAEEGTWQRSAVSEPMKFYDSTGQPIQLNRGRTWFEILSSDRKVNHTNDLAAAEAVAGDESTN